MPSLKRVFDVSIAVGVLAVTAPLFVLAAVGIMLTSPGPILYRATRIARDRRRSSVSGQTFWTPDRRREAGYRGREFEALKFRTMRVNSDATGAPITAWKDSRVFPFGAWLRATKIDELPQLFNVVRGDMALVGPRPEAPEIVRTHYTEEDLLTLRVRPGLTSPGTLYYYTHCEPLLSGNEVVGTYVRQLLPLKLALDRVYIGRATLFYDMRLVVRTAAVLAGRLVGARRFPDPPELAEARVGPARRPLSPMSLS